MTLLDFSFFYYLFATFHFSYKTPSKVHWGTFFSRLNLKLFAQFTSYAAEISATLPSWIWREFCADCLCGRATRRAGSPVARAAGPEPALPGAGAVPAPLSQGSAPASGAPGRAPGGKNCTTLSVFWIRIQYFRMNSDPDPGFWWPKIEKINSVKNLYFLIKNYYLLIPMPRTSKLQEKPS